MALTPMDIHNKEFSKGFRGYDEDEVDQFLDDIVEEFERLYKENIELKDKISTQGDQISSYKAIENTLKETLVTAQKAADDVALSAQKKSEMIIAEAEERSRKIIEKANASIIEIQKEYETVKRQILLYKARFKSLMESQMELMLGQLPDNDLDKPSFDTE